MNNKSVIIEWHSVIKDLVKNIWVILLAAIIGYMGVFIASKSVYTPEYSSTATIVVNAKGSVAGTSSMYAISSEMADVFSRVFVEPSMKAEAAAYLDIPYFNGKISASVLPDTNFLELKVTSDSPQTSYELLSAVLQVYPNISDNIFDNAVITVLKLPEMAYGPSNSISSENTTYISATCALLVAAVIVALSILRDTVKNQKAFEENVDAELIGVIPHQSKRMTVKDYIRKRKKGLLIEGNAFIGLDFVESFGKLASRIENYSEETGATVFAFTSVAENEGKSTVAANTALSLANRGHKVVLFDFDGKKPALYKIFNAKYKENSELGELFAGEIKKADFRLRRFKKTNLSLALNTVSYRDSYKWFESGVAAEIIEAIKDQADFIIIDTAPLSVDTAVGDVANLSDATVLVVRADMVKVAAVNDAIFSLCDVGGNLMGCVLNGVHPELSISGAADNGGYYYSKRYGKYSYYYKPDSE